MRPQYFALTATNNDVLSGTAFKQSGPGRYKVWAASDNATATCSVKGGKGTIYDAVVVPEDGDRTIPKVTVNEQVPVAVFDFIGADAPTIIVGGTVSKVNALIAKEPIPGGLAGSGGVPVG